MIPLESVQKRFTSMLPEMECFSYKETGFIFLIVEQAEKGPKRYTDFEGTDRTDNEELSGAICDQRVKV